MFQTITNDSTKDKIQFIYKRQRAVLPKISRRIKLNIEVVILRINIFDVWVFEIDWKAVAAISLAIAVTTIFA